MAGRGRGFSILPTKADEDDSQSEASSGMSFPVIGRGRGLVIQPQQSQSDTQSDDTSTSISPFSLIGRGRGMMMGIQPPASQQKSSETTSDDAASSISTFPLIGRGRGMLPGRSGFSAVPRLFESEKDPPTKQYEDVPSPKKSGSSGRGRASTSGLGTDEKRDSSDTPSPAQTISSKMGKMKIESPPKQPISSAEPTTSSPIRGADPMTDEQREPVQKHGQAGRPYAALTNCIMLECDKNFGIFEYDIRFTPEIDDKRLRRKCIAQLVEIIGNTRNYDGDNVLYLPIQIESQVATTPEIEGLGAISVKIGYRRKQKYTECIRFYNILFERCMSILNYQRVGRKCFDPTSPKIIPQHKLEVWPGYIKSVEEQEGGLMLLLDVSHRVLSQKSVLEFLTDVLQKSRDNWKDMAKKALIGSVVLTKYNNKTYRIDEIDFDQNPSKTFKKGDTEVSYADYFKNQYNITIKDLRQPMLISRKEVRITGEAKKQEMVFCLVPELCNMTGLTDEMRSNFTVMKDLATHTKLSPFQRVTAYKKFIENINNNEKTKALLTSWGLALESEPAKVTARLLDEEVIIFGRDKTCKVGQFADFGRGITSNEVLEPMDIYNWILMYTRNDKRAADSFEDMMMRVCGPTGIRCSAPRRVELQNDRTETYINEIRSQLNDKKIQIVVTIFPTLRDDRYAAVKRVVCSEIPCPSQCINSKTLRNEAKNRSIVQKILLQMNCKLGGPLWSIKIPLKNTMIVGIDTYHEAGNKGLTVGALVASYNSTFTKWFSRPSIQQKKEELINGLLVSMEAALRHYKDTNDRVPERIIIYRDGVGDGQLQSVESYEIPQIEEACKKFEPNYCPKITFVVVQKRINHKFFKIVNDNKTAPDSLANPPPGSVFDTCVTRRFMYDFFLCAQHVREGTLTPSHYIVLKDDCLFEPDILQKLTYKLSYLYYNWPGSVRVPAPCQYAHKLSYLVGLAVKRQVSDTLTNKLFYL